MMDPTQDYYQISQINDQIYLGPYDHPANNTIEFQKLNIDVVINFAKEIDYPIDDKYITKKFPLTDEPDASLLKYIDKASEMVDRYVKENKKIYLHCRMGVSRSPAILIYYLMKYQQMRFIDAYGLVTDKRMIDLNPNFENELRIIDEQ